MKTSKAGDDAKRTFEIVDELAESAVNSQVEPTIGDHPNTANLAFAGRSVRNLAREKQGRLGAQEAHEAWRWALLNRGWNPGPLDIAAKTHPLMVPFSKLLAGNQGHALKFAEGWDAEQDEADSAAESAEAVTR